MSRSLVLVLALAPIVATACASSEAAPIAKTQPASSTGDAQAACVEMMTRNRTCTDDFIPALVDARARHDKPPGIAESVKTDRAAVIAKAKEEWAEDSKDEAIARTCQAMTEHATQAEVDGVRACLAKDACGDYVACTTPMFEARFTK
jgi:hypothetical protein